MAQDADFVNYVLDQLQGLGDLETKNMFGGVALLRDGAAFGKIKHDRFWLKADDENRQDFLDRGMPQYTYGKDNSRTLNFFATPSEVLEDRDQLQTWARRSMAAATRTQ